MVGDRAVLQTYAYAEDFFIAFTALVAAYVSKTDEEPGPEKQSSVNYSPFRESLCKSSKITLYRVFIAVLEL